VESLERRVEELQANQSTVSGRVRDEPAAAETDPPGKHARAAVVARTGWKTAKWLYQRAIAPACRFAWRRRPRSAKVPFGLAAVAGIVVGVTYYPSYGPTVVKAAEPVITRIRQESVPLWLSIAAKIEEILREVPEIYEERVTINVNVANVREGPSTSTKTVATLPQHTELTVLERRENWVLVQIGGEGVQTGWIYNELLVKAVGH